MKSILDQRSFKNKAYCVLFAFVFFKLKSLQAALLFVLSLEILRKTKRKEALKSFDYLHCRSEENACNNKSAQL